MAGRLTIGKVARRASVTPDTIRYYERLGLVPRPARTEGGYRHYSDAVVQRLIVIRSAQRFGFSLKEIGGFLRTRDAGGKPCHQVRAAAERLLDAVDRQIATLVSAREAMQQTLEAWDARLAATPPDRPARLLEQLPTADSPTLMKASRDRLRRPSCLSRSRPRAS